MSSPWSPWSSLIYILGVYGLSTRGKYRAPEYSAEWARESHKLSALSGSN